MADSSGLTRIVENPQWELRNSQRVVQVLHDLTTPARLLALEERQVNRPIKIDNGSLPVGSPMYYYCKNCGHLAAIMPEAHRAPVPKLCPECQSLKDQKLIE